jgi:hypothetical protein
MPGPLRVIGIWSLAGVVASQVVFADPATPSLTCEAASPQEAAIVADKLFEREEYQQAGACYQLAGDMVHANLAFLKAAGPRGEDSARALKAQQEKAKSLFNRVGNAFRSNH